MAHFPISKTILMRLVYLLLFISFVLFSPFPVTADIAVLCNRLSEEGLPEDRGPFYAPSFKALHTYSRQYFDTDSVVYLPVDALEEEVWISRTTLLVMPGGPTSTMEENLSEKARQNLQKYITEKEESRTLAICGSATLLSTTTTYEGLHDGRPKERLGILPMNAIGPAFEEKGSVSVHLEATDTIHFSHYYGGCYFTLPGGKVPDGLSVLGHYRDVPGGIESVVYNLDSGGRIIACQSHPELVEACPEEKRGGEEEGRAPTFPPYMAHIFSLLQP